MVVARGGLLDTLLGGSEDCVFVLDRMDDIEAALGDAALVPGDTAQDACLRRVFCVVGTAGLGCVTGLGETALVKVMPDGRAQEADFMGEEGGDFKGDEGGDPMPGGGEQIVIGEIPRGDIPGGGESAPNIEK